MEHVAVREEFRQFKVGEEAEHFAMDEESERFKVGESPSCWPGSKQAVSGKGVRVLWCS